MVIRHDVDHIVKPKRKALKIVLFSILAIILGIGIWVGVSAYRAVSKVTALSGSNGNLFSLLKNDNPAVKGQSEGRTNILLLGMAGQLPAPYLTDSMMVLSIEWKTKKTAMISIPRDLWVSIPGYGSAKLNEAYAYGEKNSKTTGGGGKVASDMISTILGVPVHYFVSVDFEGFKKIVDEVGGVDVVVEQALYDPSYPADNMIDFSPFRISAGEHQLDGKTALKYARCRKGNCGDDFGRAKRQQQVILSLKQKTLTANILANPKKLTDLFNILGKHLKTNMSVTDIKSFWDSFKDLDLSNMINKVLDTAAGGPLVSSTSSGGAYIILPKKGANNYTDLQAIAKNIFVDAATSAGSSTVRTDPSIQVLNGSGKAGQATLEADILKKTGYTSVTTGNVAVTALTAVYNCSGTSTQVVADKIAKTLNVTTKTKASCGSGIDIQVIMGQNALAR